MAETPQQKQRHAERSARNYERRKAKAQQVGLTFHHYRQRNKALSQEVKQALATEWGTPVGQAMEKGITEEYRNQQYEKFLERYEGDEARARQQMHRSGLWYH